MVTVVKQNDPWEHVGNILGGGLSALAAHKLKGITEKAEVENRAKSYIASGTDPKKAYAIASTKDPKERRLFLADDIENRANAPLNEVFGKLGGAKVEQPGTNTALGPIQPALETPGNQALMQELGIEKPTDTTEHFTSPSVRQALGLPALERAPTQDTKTALLEEAKQAIAQPEPTEIDILKDALKNPNIKASKKVEFAKLLKDYQKEAKREERENRKESLEERKFAHKATGKLREEAIQIGKDAHDRLESLDRLQDLEDEGLASTAANEFLVNAGIDIPALKGAATEEYEKIAGNFMGDMKKYYGGKISDYEVKQFLKLIPSLMQSPEGRKRVIANMRRLERNKLEYSKIVRKLSRDSTIKPEDLGEEVADAMDKVYEKNSKLFKDDLKREVPEGSSTAAIVAGHYGGKAIGAIPSLLKTGAKAGAGAYAGYKYGGIPGAVAGGALGLTGLKGLLE